MKSPLLMGTYEYKIENKRNYPSYCIFGTGPSNGNGSSGGTEHNRTGSVM